MKKTMMLALSAILGLTLLLGACSQKENTNKGSESAAPSAAGSDITEAGSLPITKEKTTLKVLMYGNSLVENFATNEFTKWLEEQTNIHIEWEIAPEKSASEKLNISLAGGDYPDVIMGFTISPVQMSLYGKDGVFLPLNDLIEKYGVETKKMFETISYAKEIITAPDGNIYGLPQINECYHCTMPQKMWINQEWLTKLGLEMPTTTEQFYEVLKAFKEKDPNGNGKQDEIPYAGFLNNGPELFLMSSFVEKDVNDMIVENGKIGVAFTQPAWKEGLLYLRKLYAEGLIAPETFTQDVNGVKKMSGDAERMFLGAVSGIFTGSVLPSPERVTDFAAVPPLEGPSGLKSASLNPFGLSQGTYVITNNAKNPEAAFRLADFLYGEEATMRAIFGRPDQEWTSNVDGATSISGEPAKWKRLINAGLQNYGWSQTGPSLRSSAFRLSEAAAPGTQETILYQETKQKYEPAAIDAGKVVPPLFFTKDQSEELANLSKTITDYKKEFLAKAVTGNVDIEKEWDEYLKTLDKMNLPRYLQIYQEAFDAKNK